MQPMSAASHEPWPSFVPVLRSIGYSSTARRPRLNSSRPRSSRLTLCLFPSGHRSRIWKTIPIAIELCEEYGRPFALLSNAADKEWKNTAETAKAAALLGEVLPVNVRYHEGHAASSTDGQSAAEFLKGRSKTAAVKEAEALWDAIKARLPKGRRA
jgi:hypothetical protein